MIAGNESAMIKTLQDLMETREELERIKAASQSVYQVTRESAITRGEYLGVLESRLAKLQADAHNLGINGPAAKHSARGQAIATMHSRETHSSTLGGVGS